MSDADWEKEDFEAPTFTKPVLGDRWEGEDEEDDIKDNWDDEDALDNAEDEKNENEDKVNPVKKKKSLSQIIAEKEEKRKKELEEKKAKEELELTPEEIYAEKMQQQKLQEDADLELAKEAFGINEIQNQDTIEGMRPSTKEDFDNFRKSLVNKIAEFEKSTHFVPFLEDLFRELCINLETDDVKRLTSALNALTNEKVKAQKSTKHKKKKTKASLNVGKDGDYQLNYADEYEDFI